MDALSECPDVALGCAGVSGATSVWRTLGMLSVSILRCSPAVWTTSVWRTLDALSEYPVVLTGCVGT